jgi:MFS transporter, NNP family, nitrate/nitrite transporter
VQPIVKKSLHLTKRHMWFSHLAAVSSTFIGRVAFGPICDVYGPKVAMGATLIVGSIPVFCSGMVHNWVDLCVVRAAVGLLGSTFVMSQAWTSLMYVGPQSASEDRAPQ